MAPAPTIAIFMLSYPALRRCCCSAAIAADEAPRAALAPSRANRLVEKVAIALDVRREVERVLPGKPLGQLSVPMLDRLDDFQVIDDRARRAIVLRDRDLADSSHV